VASNIRYQLNWNSPKENVDDTWPNAASTRIWWHLNSNATVLLYGLASCDALDPGA
jgi:hypothetical protein